MKTLARFAFACVMVGAAEAIVAAAIRHHLETEQELIDTRKELIETKDHLSLAHLRLLFANASARMEGADVETKASVPGES